MCGVGVLQVHRICNSRLVYKEVVEAQLDYKIYIFRNMTCGDSTGSNRMKKSGFLYLLRLFGRRGRRRRVF